MSEALPNTIADKLANYHRRLQSMPTLQVEGRLIRMIGLTLEAVGINVPVGTRCNIITADGHKE